VFLGATIFSADIKTAEIDGSPNFFSVSSVLDDVCNLIFCWLSTSGIDYTGVIMLSPLSLVSAKGSVFLLSE
jgi:hypothetical protein